MITVTIIRDPFDTASVERFEGVDSVRQTIMDAFGEWPSTARIYDGAVAEALDVTPRVPDDVAALEDITSGHAVVVVYPGDVVTVLLAIVAVLAAASVFFLMPQIPDLRNQQAQSGNNQLTDRQNRARPNGRIPDIYGRVRSTPDLIAAPYTVFIANQEIEVAYMCVGRGEFEIEDIRDDSTDFATIEGASVEIYGPETSPNSGSAVQTIGTAIGREVLTAKRITSVNGQVLEPSDWIGPFTVELRGMDKVQINLVAVQGMFKDDGDDQTSTSVTCQIEVTPLDDSGMPSGSAITQNATVVGSATDRDLKGVTSTVTLAAVTRKVRVRVQRTTPLNTVFEGTVVDEVKWRDCYGLAPVDQDHFGDVTTVMAQTYATAGALAVKNRKLNMLVTRKLPERDGEYEFSATLTATQNAASILCAMALDSAVGRLTDGTLITAGGTGQIDVPQIFDEVAEAVTYFGLTEAGQFNYTFDDPRLSFQEMAQIVAGAVFCQAYRQGSVLRLRLERPQADSVLLINHANKAPGTEVRSYSFGSPDGHDGVALAYVDPADDAVVTLYVPQGDDTAINPLKVEGRGVRGFEHAYLQAWRYWNRLKYRYLTEACTVMQEGNLLARGDRVLSVDTTRSRQLDGEIVEQVGLILTLSQPAPLDSEEFYTCFLQTDAGSVEAIAVTQGVDEFHVVLDEAPVAAIITDPEAAYRTGYVIVQDESDSLAAQPMLITEKDPKEGFTVELEAINYDARYYANDLDYFAEESGEGTDPDDPEVIDGEADPAVEVSISPPATSTAGSAPSNTATFTASGTGGAAPPSSYTWGVISGAGVVVSSLGNTASLRIIDTSGFGSLAQFFCDMVIDGVTYRAFCTMTHTYLGETTFPSPYEYPPDYIEP